MTAVPIRSQRWRDRAACKDADPELFFPPEEGGRRAARKAKAICARCPVTAECLEHAVRHGEHWGVWGGVAERDRRQPRASGVSRFRGVVWSKSLGKWIARATIDGRRVHLGVFTPDAEEKAGRAVLVAEGASPELAASLIPQPRKVAA